MDTNIYSLDKDMLVNVFGSSQNRGHDSSESGSGSSGGRDGGDKVEVTISHDSNTHDTTTTIGYTHDL